jgi:hypothetical protein
LIKTRIDLVSRHEDVVDDHFDFEFRADGRISAGDVQKSKGGASNSESGFGGASHIGTQNVDVSVAADNKGQCSSCFTVTTRDESIVDLMMDVIQVSVEKSNVEYLDTFYECTLYKLQVDYLPFWQ